LLTCVTHSTRLASFSLAFPPLCMQARLPTWQSSFQCNGTMVTDENLTGLLRSRKEVDHRPLHLLQFETAADYWLTDVSCHFTRLWLGRKHSFSRDKECILTRFCRRYAFKPGRWDKPAGERRQCIAEKFCSAIDDESKHLRLIELAYQAAIRSTCVSSSLIPESVRIRFERWLKRPPLILLSRTPIVGYSHEQCDAGYLL
jgi:hypothetical protein